MVKYVKSQQLENIEKFAENYERSGMLRDDSEVELDYFTDCICVCDYSPSRNSAEIIKEFYDIDGISANDVETLCNKHDWYFVG